MNTPDVVRDLMRAIRLANPDVMDIELEGIRDPGDALSYKINSALEIFHDINWKVRVTFNDGDWYETELYDDELTPLRIVQDRLGKWVGK